MTSDLASPGDPAPVDDYDELFRKGGFGYESQRAKWEAWVAERYVAEFDLQPGQSLIDVGCGDGFWSSIFVDQGFHVIGIDLSPGGIEVARKQYPGIEFQVRDIEELMDTVGETYDVVFCRSIGHLNRSYLFQEGSLRMAANLIGLAKPGGIVLVSQYTKRDGSQSSPNHAYHRLSDLVKLFEGFGDVFKVDVVSNYVQIGIQHWSAPRKRVQPSTNTGGRFRQFNRRVRKTLRR